MTAKELAVVVEKELWKDADEAVLKAQQSKTDAAWAIVDAARNRASASTRVVLACS